MNSADDGETGLITHSNSTVFLDRDGTINVNLPFPNVNTPEKLELIPGAAEGVRMLNDHGFRVVVLTNQAGIENPENDLDMEMFNIISETLNRMLMAEAGARVDDTFVCPHRKDEGCECRKPGTGLFEQALKASPDINLETSYMVGDRSDDMIAGRKAGLKTVLVLTGHGETTLEELKETEYEPDHVAGNMLEAAEFICR